MRILVPCLLLGAVLTGCGGGGSSASESAATTLQAPGSDGSTGSSGPGTRTPGLASAASDVVAACTACAAVDSNTYAGSGIGVWERTNNTGAAIGVPVSIRGLTGQNVTLVFTNESSIDSSLPPISMATPQPSAALLDQYTPAADPHAAISEFNRTGWAQEVAKYRQSVKYAPRILSAQPPASTNYSVGDSRNFFNEDSTLRTAMLQQQVATSDGTKVNFWVEASEWGAGKVTVTLLSQLSTAFTRPGGVYDMLKTMGGPLWGPNNAPAGQFIPSANTIDIVLLNLDKNGTPFGMLGYFWGLNNLTKAVDSRSNESLSLYLDTETSYLGGERGVQALLSTMAHEGMHMSNFYRRSVLKGTDQAYDTWLEEMTALMMEDVAASNISTTYSPVRDSRVPQYLQYGSYNCSLVNWTPYAGACESYSIASSFGGFLLRQFGIDFYKHLLNVSAPGSVSALQGAIVTARADSSIGEQLRHFAATTISGMPATAPNKFGYPARSEQGFSLQAVDVSKDLASRKLPITAPSSVMAYGSFPVVRYGVVGTFTETVKVPPGTTLSVVVN